MFKHFETLDEAGEAFKKGEINVTELREFFKEFIETTKDNEVEDDPTGILRDLLANKKEFDIDRVLFLMQNNGYPSMSKRELCQTISNLASEAYDKMIGTTKDNRKSCGTSSRYGITITCFPEVDAVGYKVEYVYAETYLNGIAKKNIQTDIDKAEYLANRKLYKSGARLIDGGYSVEGVTVDNVQNYLDEDHSPESLFPGFIYDWTNVKGVCYTLVCIEGIVQGDTGVDVRWDVEGFAQGGGEGLLRGGGVAQGEGGLPAIPRGPAIDVGLRAVPWIAAHPVNVRQDILLCLLPFDALGQVTPQGAVVDAVHQGEVGIDLYHPAAAGEGAAHLADDVVVVLAHIRHATTVLGEDEAVGHQRVDGAEG